MNCLLLDTATEACSVALHWQDKLISRFEVCPQQHSQRILPMVDEVISELKAELSGLDFIAFGRGPGSFTGVRIATGMLQGLALGANLPAIGISTLAAMAQQAIDTHQAKDVFCAIDARMGEVYFAHYRAIDGLASLQGAEQVLAPVEATKLLSGATQAYGVGTGWAAYAELDPTKQVHVATDILYPDAKFMLPLAIALFNQGQTQSAAEVQPVYVRDTVTWKKLPGKE